MTLFLISFIAGVLTILAPCILPLLPVIVGKSITDSTLSKRRVFVVVLSLGLSVILFTLILKVSTLFINIPQSFWTWISGGIIFIFGLVTLFPNLWENMPFISKINSKINNKSNKTLMSGYQKNNIWGDVIVGASLGPIFSACSPTYFVILATVLPVSPTLGMLYLFTYAFGLCLALLLVSFLGQKIMTKLNIVSDSHGWFKRTLGVIFILVSISILTGYDKKLQISILDAGFFDVTKVEQNLLKNSQSEILDTTIPAKNNTPPDTSSTGIPVKDNMIVKSENQNKQVTNFLTPAQKKDKFILAPELSTIDGYVNTDGKPITIGEFKGKKVVLLDIWTYSCINCQRTIPYLNDWYKKYQDQGLVIIGLHTPEFSFERIQKNVEEAVKNLGIKYPVVLDNDFSTWNAYQNQYWPREYLIDLDGYIVHDHAGEGAYAETEQSIQNALKERSSRLGNNFRASGAVNPTDRILVDPNQVNSPETYFGSARNEYLANGTVGQSGEQTFSVPPSVSFNKLYLGGTWNITSEYAQSKSVGSIVFNYEAKNVYITAGSLEGIEVEIFKNDVFVKKVLIKDETLYPLIQDADYGKHTLRIVIPKAGLQAFTFTFG